MCGLLIIAKFYGRIVPHTNSRFIYLYWFLLVVGTIQNSNMITEVVIYVESGSLFVDISSIFKSYRRP